MLEELLKVKIAMIEKKSKAFVYERYQEYLDIYHNMDKDMRNKMLNRELFFEYTRYMAKETNEQQ